MSRSHQDLRDEIDAVDSMLLGAFIRRMRAVRKLQEATKLSPEEAGSAHLAIEAAGIRKLVEGTPSDLPAEAVERFCRAFVGECAVYQGFDTVTFPAGDEQRMVTAARGFFGYGVNLEPAGDWREALQIAAQRQDAVAFMPWPELPGAGQWWPALIEDRLSELRILAGWPSMPTEADNGLEAALVARRKCAPSGNDDTFAIAHDDLHEADDAMHAAGMQGSVVARVRSLALLRLKGFVSMDDPRLAMLRSSSLEGFRIVGVLPIMAAQDARS